jgi:hypothetical protein
VVISVYNEVTDILHWVKAMAWVFPNFVNSLSLAGFSGFEGGAIAPMKSDETLHFIFAAELKPSALASFIHFGSPIPSKDEMH